MELRGSLPHSQGSTTCPYPSHINPFLCPSHFWQAQFVYFLVGLRTYQHPGITLWYILLLTPLVSLLRREKFLKSSVWKRLHSLATTKSPLPSKCPLNPPVTAVCTGWYIYGHGACTLLSQQWKLQHLWKDKRLSMHDKTSLHILFYISSNVLTFRFQYVM